MQGLAKCLRSFRTQGRHHHEIRRLDLVDGNDRNLKTLLGHNTVPYANHRDETTFYVVNAFANAADRQKHLEGEIAAALMANAEELLAEPPTISQVDILAAKTS
ncbi:MAG: antibiotic biosynthesis monooxygenase [Acidobacteriota bacterium]